MRITIISMEFPYPPNHGGRVDIWRRIMALKHLGVDLQLIFWDYSIPSSQDIAVIKEYVEDFIPIVYSKGVFALLRRGVDFLKYPLQVTSRIVRGTEEQQLFQQVDKFQPDVILADHVHCGLLAKELSKALDIPFIVRSHDIEHLHYTYWLKSAKGLAWLKLMLCLWHLKNYEFSILKDSLLFYDISVDDLDFWKQQGFSNGKFLAPLLDNLNPSNSNIAESVPIAERNIQYDVVFLGNLRTENNVAGVIWFLNEVLPRIKSNIPNIQVLISGSKPVQTLVDICEKLEGVTLVANPVSAKEVYQSGKVLINPVSTGSGTSIKSIDMLTLNRPIITLKKGVQGLPISARKYFRVAGDAQSFSDLVCSSLKDFKDFSRNQDEINELFGYPAIKEFIVDLQSSI